MAFLCPAKLKKSKKKKEFDQYPLRRNLTGSASLDTLTQVGLAKKDGLDPEARLIVIQDFVACVDDEVSVKKGDIVYALYRDNDWLYILCDNGKEGFVPISYTTQAIRKQQRTVDNDIKQNTLEKDSHNNSGESYISYQEASIFHKRDCGKFLVVYNFDAVNDNDITVESGDIITVLNVDDPNWFWIIKNCKQEGFIPASYLVPIIHTDPTGKGV
ncbi:SH3 domain-containing protein Dlish-like [Octopus sinensis]|uniref:SH3 domain-containing protein Dlish-like n=1 Tax=Octopus sinensis TaxID=2607531 RepID=A0A6P7TA91_9MOLL|nr:SH3 domain-containing protein Dlish-like [Octopus sinensis]